MPKNVLPFESCCPFAFTYQAIVPSQSHARKSQVAFKHLKNTIKSERADGCWLGFWTT